MTQPEPSGPVQFATADGRVQVGDWVRFVHSSFDKAGVRAGRLVGVVFYVLADKGGGWQEIVTDAGTVSSADVLEVRRAAAPAAKQRGRRGAEG